MHTAEISKDLSTALNFLEEILNNKDSGAVIETIKKYKQMKNSSNSSVTNIFID